MRSQRGSSVIEVLVAAVVAVGVVLGLTIFFLTTLRVGKYVDAQAALQRQGSAIADEIGRQLRLVDGTRQGTPTVCTIAGESCGVVPGANIVFTVSAGTNHSETFGLAIVANRH